MPVTWNGSVAVITGGASGIGRAMAEQAASRGARVAIADISEARATAVADEIRATGATACGYACDVSDRDQLYRLAERVRGDLGGVNLLFNNAGVVVTGTIEETTAEDAAWLVSVNLLGAFNGINAFLPMLREARSAGLPAHIVATGSENSLGLPPGVASFYTATKHAVFGLMDALRRDLSDSGIGVSIICPGLVNTNIYDAGRNRAEGFGGPILISAEQADAARQFMARGQDPQLTARLAFEGLERGDFIIVTDPTIAACARLRAEQVEAALQVAEGRSPGDGCANGRG